MGFFLLLLFLLHGNPGRDPAPLEAAGRKGIQLEMGRTSSPITERAGLGTLSSEVVLVLNENFSQTWKMLFCNELVCPFKNSFLRKPLYKLLFKNIIYLFI